MSTRRGRATRATHVCIFLSMSVGPLASACGGAAPGVRRDCPVGQTFLDGTCVTQQIADYVACIRAMGATVASNSAKELSAAAGVAGVTASTRAEVQDKLEKSYAKVSDANSLEIIHDCEKKTAHEDVAAAPPPQAADPPPESASAGSASDQGQVATPKTGASSASAFVGKWRCVSTLDIEPMHGQTAHIPNIPGNKMVVDNGDGTISVLGEKDDGQCPMVWAVHGSTANARLVHVPCRKQDGSVIQAARGDATLSGNSLAVNATISATGPNGAAEFRVAEHCAR